MGYFTQPPGQGWIELGNMLKLFLSPTPTPFIPKLLKTVLNLTNRICRPVTITFITFCAFQCRAHPSWRTDSLGIPWRAYIRENILSGTCRASHMNTAAQIYCQEQTMCLFEFSGHVDKPYGHHVSFNLHINLLMIHKWVGIFFKITLLFLGTPLQNLIRSISFTLRCSSQPRIYLQLTAAYLTTPPCLHVLGHVETISLWCLRPRPVVKYIN